MKRTELERRERELRRSLKKDDVLRRKTERIGLTVGDYIDQLSSLFRHDEQHIFNTTDDIHVLELLEGMKVDQPEKQWDTIIRKAIGRTKVTDKEKAFNELSSLVYG